MNQLSGLDAAFPRAWRPRRPPGTSAGSACLTRPMRRSRWTWRCSPSSSRTRLDLVPVLRQKLPRGAARPGPAVLGRRPGLRPRVPHPGARATPAGLGRAALRTDRPAARPPARPRPAALGDLPDHRLTGGRIAVYTKIHHAAIDGRSGAELLTVLLELSPAGRELPAPKAFRPGGMPNRAALRGPRGGPAGLAFRSRRSG